MNSIIDDIAERLLNGNMQEFEIDVLVSSLKGYGVTTPLKVKFADGETEIGIKTLMEFVKQYGCSPTTCESVEDFEKKLVAMRI